MGGPTRRALEPWQREDAKRLRDLWDAKRPMSQERFAAEYFNATQGAVFQYIDGRIPLNLDAVIKFATGLNAKVDDISPSLAARLRAVMGNDRDPLLPFRNDERQLLERYRASPPRWQLSLRTLAMIATEEIGEIRDEGQLFPKISTAGGAPAHKPARRIRSERKP